VIVLAIMIIVNQREWDNHMGSSYVPPKPKLLSRQYKKMKPLYSKLIDEIIHILNESLDEKNLKISGMEGRIKDINSIYQKAIKNEITGNVFEKINDIAGIRIICLYRSDLRILEEIIRSKLDVIDAKIIHNRTDFTFGYMSDHYTVRILSSFSGERYDSIKKLKCEIQVRTIAMHVWATISHDLDYKQEVDIPSHLKNDFYALSGIVYVADSLFEQFRNARQESIGKLLRNIKEDKFNLKDEMNLDTLRAFLHWKFPDRATDEPFAVSQLLYTLAREKINNFKELNRLIDENVQWLIDKENSQPKSSLITAEGKVQLVPFKYTALGVMRVILIEKMRIGVF
jgi:putative GTP pyrophosphokinase